MLRRLHKWMLYHCQWWVYTRGDVSRVCLRHSAHTRLREDRAKARARLSVITHELTRWNTAQRSATKELRLAEDALRRFAQEEE